jgi:hypothetical protein
MQYVAWKMDFMGMRLNFESLLKYHRFTEIKKNVLGKC